MIPNVHLLTLQGSSRVADTEALLTKDCIALERFYGVNAAKMGLTTIHPYEIDHPGSNYIMPSKHVGMHLSHFLLWRHLKEYHSEPVYTVFEDDVRMVSGWQERFITSINSVPDDWDMLFLGSCCTDGKPSSHVLGNVHKVYYPLCTHAYMVSRKALPVLLETQEKSWAPIDLALNFNSFPMLKVYTVLPRIADQYDTILTP